MNHGELVEIGDWVTGKTKNGELIHGFVESTDSLRGTVKVYVVDSDNDIAVGKSIVTVKQWIDVLPVSTFEDEEHMSDLIDLALVTKDKEWFRELTAKTAKRQASRSSGGFIARKSSIRNRLGSSAIWEQ
ncbi:IDEAL domain-containing protein [Brevibacillus sp. NRS-1366]|uniref:IDEAL domain-containing protein n=1 Tax=Brevibacillus sp. NRS-1366 TaxID=3233899 RepID=UPI003D206196